MFRVLFELDFTARRAIGVPMFFKLRWTDRSCSAILGLDPMSYHVVAFTMAQVRQGALEFQRQLSAVVREMRELKVYSASPFDLEERRRVKDRFGGDVVYFFNDVAYEECHRMGLDLQFVAEIPDEELPRRRTVVVGMPESKTTP